LNDEVILLHLNTIFPIILNSMQDKSYSVKREAALKTFVTIVKNTGYVALPYFKYPHL